MTHRSMERGAWAVSVLLIAVATAGVLRPGGVSHAPSSAPRRGAPLAPPPAESIAVWSRSAASRNPFRLDRRPAAIRFGEVVQTQAEPDRTARPELTLLGTSGGPPWQGVLAGLPGLSAPVVIRAGDRVAGFVIQSVSQDRAVVASMDTTWTLITKRALR